MNLQEKIDKWKQENNFDYSYYSESEFFEWLQGCEYPGATVEYNGLGGTYPQKKYYTITFEDETIEDFCL